MPAWIVAWVLTSFAPTGGAISVDPPGLSAGASESVPDAPKLQCAGPACHGEPGGDFLLVDACFELAAEGAATPVVP